MENFLKDKKNYYILIILSIIIITLLIFNLYYNNKNIVYAQSIDYEKSINNAITIQEAFRKIAKENIPSVVRIDTVSIIENNRTEIYNKGFGSGVIIEKDNNNYYYVITNNHVVSDTKEINIILFNDKEFVGELVGKDLRSDLAVVKFKSNENLILAKIGKSSDVNVGDWAICIGNPFGYNGSLTVGVISALGRSMIGKTDATDFIQTDAAINPGNSGGPLLNIKGEVIGINSWIASQTGSNTGLSFAIPIDNAINIYTKLKKYQIVEYAWLGVMIKSLTDTNFRKSIGITREHGAYVTEVIINSPAEKYNIKVGDIIIGVDDKTIKDANELIWTISKYNPFDKVKLTIISNNIIKTIEVELGKRPSNEDLSKKNIIDGLEFLGAIYNNISNDIMKELKLKSNKGVIIKDIKQNSPSFEYGLEINDIITKINTKNIDNLNDLDKFIKESEINKTEFYYFYLIRNGREMVVGVQK